MNKKPRATREPKPFPMKPERWWMLVHYDAGFVGIVATTRVDLWLAIRHWYGADFRLGKAYRIVRVGIRPAPKKKGKK